MEKEFLPQRSIKSFNLSLLQNQLAKALASGFL
jgi:hypothetical protein